MDGLKKKMQVPTYEAKVPESVRAENLEKLNTYEREFAENEKGQGELANLM